MTIDSGDSRLDPDPRPEWVRQAINLCDDAIDHLNVLILISQDISLLLQEQKLAHQDLADAAHDAAHVREHFTSERRGLRMAWPWEPGDKP